MSLADHILHYHFNLALDLDLPEGIELIDPYGDEETRRCMELFYSRYYSDDNERVVLFGINPGRFGAGVTGIPFTDPVRLEEDCSIANSFQKRAELSSTFIYDSVHACGGPEVFFGRYYISSVFPLGFLKDGKNYNYYDSSELISAVSGSIDQHIERQLEFGVDRTRAYSIGRGKNLDFLARLNKEKGFFGEIIPLPHPRWVMQYRLKRKQEFIEEYVTKLAYAG